MRRTIINVTVTVLILGAIVLATGWDNIRQLSP